jgi:hypothetical protein
LVKDEEPNEQREEGMALQFIECLEQKQGFSPQISISIPNQEDPQANQIELDGSDRKSNILIRNISPKFSPQHSQDLKSY